MGENSEYIKKDGKISFGSGLKQDRAEVYFGDLYPPELMGTNFERVKNKVEKLNFNEPNIILYKGDIHKTVFCAIKLLLNHFQYTSRVVDSTYLRQQYLSGDYVDLSKEFEYCKVLFITANYTDIPHMYNPFCIKQVCDARRLQGLKTFVFFRGTMEDLKSNRWMLDVDGVGSNVQGRRLEPLTNYISYLDLNTSFKEVK